MKVTSSWLLGGEREVVGGEETSVELGRLHLKCLDHS